MTSPPAVAAPPANDAVAHTTSFFDALLGFAPDELHACLWTLQDKRSTWVPLADGPEPVAAAARSLSDAGNDVYVSVSCASSAGSPEQRIKSANAAGIFGLWADIDIADPDVHKKWNLPPSIESAEQLLRDVGLPPTLIIHSGHGLQVWWLFKEFWAFDTEEHRLEAATLAQRWNTTLQVTAALRGWVVDSTFDLARVMRVPGTLNRKGDPVMPVRLTHVGGPRYEPDDFAGYHKTEEALGDKRLSSGRSYQPAPDFKLGTKLDWEMLQALGDNHETFRTTWDMKRLIRDFPDQSASSYDLSLCTIAAGAGWPDEQLAALIYEFRKRHKLDLEKATRPDYVRRTIIKARDKLIRDEAAEQMDEAAAAIEEAIASGDPEEERDTRRNGLDVASARIGIEVIHVIKYLSEPHAWALQTPTKLIQLGGSDGLIRWDKFRQTVLGYTNVLIDRFKPAEWDETVRLLVRCAEEQDVGAEATEQGEIDAWLRAYLSQRPPVDSLTEAASSEYPYVGEDGRVVLFGPGFRRWLYLTYQERVTNKEVGRRLRAFGCEPDKVNVDEKGKRTSRGIWRLPPGMGA